MSSIDVVSSTAAWSSQIVAFWGAVGIGVRCSTSAYGQRSNNSLTSFSAFLAALTRARSAAAALRAGHWYVLAPGFNGGKIRLDVVLLSWTTPAHLLHFCIRVCLLAETVGRQRWLLLLLGKRVSTQSLPVGAYWTHSPRCADFTITRFSDTGEIYSAFSLQLLIDYYNDANNSQRDDDVASFIHGILERRATRTGFVGEVPIEVQSVSSLGRHITSIDVADLATPFMSLDRQVAEFTSSRIARVNCAVWMYCIVYVMVCVAVGLMGAASGRGLAVWIFAPRLIMSRIGAEAIPGDDGLMSLQAFQSLRWRYSSEASNVVSIAGDTYIEPGSIIQSARFFGLGLILNVLEFGLVVGGWLYGALRIERLPPRGLVGHGMLWLSTVVSIGLSLRTLVSLHRRLSGRLIGLFNESQYFQRVIASDCRISLSSDTKSEYLLLVSKMLSSDETDNRSMEVALSLIRQPVFSYELGEQAGLEHLGYVYEGDTLVKERKERKLSTAGVYPWVQVSLCVFLTVVCAMFGPVYAYKSMPLWSKHVSEVLLAVSATWFATLSRTSKLHPDQSTQVCHMVATMVASAVWYVGVKDVG